jgi:hypothetical protein
LVLPTDKPLRTPRKIYLLPAAAALILAAVGYFPTRLLAGRAGLAAMVAAQAIVLVVIYGTLAPALSRMTADGAARLRIGLAVGVVRFLLTMLLGAVIVWKSFFVPPVFLIWLAVSYVVLIKVETWTFIWLGKKLDKSI